MSSFLAKYIEEGMVIPGDGRNGPCTVYYNWPNATTTMTVNLVDGKREGEAIIRVNGNQYWKLEYRNGELNGVIEEYASRGQVILRGHCVNGVEVGLFEEYWPDGTLYWRGYYRNGKRYSQVTKSATRNGYYEERRVGSNQILSIAQYDELLHDKNGHCIEYEDGEVVCDWLYINGVRVKMIEGFGSDYAAECVVNGRREEDVTLWDDDISLPFERGVNASFAVYDIMRGSIFGVVKRADKWYQIELGAYKNRIIEADPNGNGIRVYEGHEWKTIAQDVKGCIDLDVNGERWEGGVKDGEPFGYGVLYDGEGEKVYEGFMANGRRICYGRDFYSDINALKYDGCYANDRRCGYGVLYERKGTIDYEGLWDDGNPYVISNSTRFHTLMESIDIPSSSFNRVEQFLLPCLFQSLKQLVIGDCCFQHVKQFLVDGLNELEIIRIGEWCFSFSSRWDVIRDSTDKSASCRIRNCPKLESIRSGDYSFSSYHSFELETLPSLKTLELGKKCCYSCPEFSLAGRDD